MAVMDWFDEKARKIQEEEERAIAERRFGVFSIDPEMLVGMFAGEGLVSFCKAPQHLKYVSMLPQLYPDVIRMLVASPSFEPVPDGEEPPQMVFQTTTYLGDFHLEEIPSVWR